MFLVFACDSVCVEMRIGMWSDESLVSVFHVVLEAVVFVAAEMSGEEFCWLWAGGRRVGVFVLRVRKSVEKRRSAMRSPLASESEECQEGE